MNIFCLRGLVRETAHWGDFLGQIEKRIPEAKTIPLELAGNGERYREESPLQLADAVEDLRHYYLPHTKTGPQILFALSLGGMIAAEWLRLYPKDFNAVVLINSSFRNFSAFHKRLRWQNYGSIAKILLSPSPEKRERAILQLVSNRHAQDQKLLQEWTGIQKKHPISKRNAFRQIRSAYHFEAPEQKPSSAPLLVFTSEGDRLVNYHCSLEIARRWQAELRVHSNAGHDLSLDEPEWVLAELRSWLQTQLQA